jgi:long-chain acyl-CoA synthetase
MLRWGIGPSAMPPVVLAAGRAIAAVPVGGHVLPSPGHSDDAWLASARSQVKHMGENACDDVFGWAAREPRRVTFARQAGEDAGSEWVPVTAAEFASRVAAVAAGLVAQGIQPGDRIGLLAATSLDWVTCDFATWAVGAVTVPLYETSSPDQVRWELGDSGAVAVFAGSARHAETVRRAAPGKVEAVWELDAGCLDKLAEAGKHVAPEEITERRGAVTSASVATIVYTSGTTGRPKGCALTHGNLTEAVRAVLSAPGVRNQVIAGAASSLFFLPLSHILARVVSLCLVREGKRIGFLASPDDLAEAVVAFRPTILLVVPRVLEKVAAAARQRARAEGHGRVFAAAEATAIAWSRTVRGSTGGRRAGIGLRLRHAAYDRLVYARLRDALGGQARWVISGGAPLAGDLARFLNGAGITVMEGWGLTETAGPVTMNPPGAQRFGSVGLPLPGCAVRVTGDGEIEVQGPGVFPGYWQDPQSSAEAFDGRWFRTGDLGRIDDGYLYLTGRKKELIITAGGKNVVPSLLEDRVREHWLVAECVAVGDRRPYIAALVTLDPVAFARWKQRYGKPAAATPAQLREDQDLAGVIQQAIDRANAEVSRAEAIKRFRILDADFAVGAELTPTQKVRRDYVLDKYADDVAALYLVFLS